MVENNIFMQPDANNTISGARKSKKIPILIAASIIVLIIALLAIVLAVSKNNQSPEENNKNAFNIFKNYVIYGDEDDQSIKNDYVSETALSKAINENDTDFLRQSIKYYEAFLDEYNENSSANEEDNLDGIPGNAKAIYINLQTLMTYTQVDLINIDKFVEYYAANGESQTKEEIDKQLALFENYDAISTDNGDTLDNLKIYFSAGIDFLSELDKQGCFSSKDTNACISSAKISDNLQNRVAESKVALLYAQNNMIQLANRTTEIVKQFNAESDDE